MSPGQQSARCGDTGGSSRRAPPAQPLCPLQNGLATPLSAPHARPSRGDLPLPGNSLRRRRYPAIGTDPGGRRGRAGQGSGPSGSGTSDGAGRPMLPGVPRRPARTAGIDGSGEGGARDPALRNGAVPDPPPGPSRGMPEPRTSRWRCGAAWPCRGAPPAAPAAAARRVPPGSAVSGAAPSPDRRRRRRARALTAPPPPRSAPSVPPSPRPGAGVPGIYGPAAPAPACLLQYRRLRAAAAAPGRAGPRQVGEPCRARAAAG